MNDYERGGFVISTDPNRLDLDAVERLMRASYWAAERARDAIERAIHTSLCFGLYESHSGRQVGFARVVTDYGTFAWLCDVIVDEAQRQKGLGKWLMECVLADPKVAHVRRWILATHDAHGLYERYGFRPLADPGFWMERVQRG